jgi:hypothetical protein
MQRERPGHTLQATALVNEAYLRLVGGDPLHRRTARISSPLPRTPCTSVLDYARRRHAGKRGAPVREVDIDAGLYHRPGRWKMWFAIDSAGASTDRSPANRCRTALLRWSQCRGRRKSWVSPR